MNELKHLLNKELSEPSPEFVKHFARQVYPSVITAKILEQFTELTKKSVQHYISDLITERLKIALSKEDEKNKIENLSENSLERNSDDISKINTTEEELEGYLIVKTILRQKVSLSRITYRDAQSYFSVFLDDNNRKPVCRLYFNGNKKFIGLFDENKKETKIELENLDDIFNYSGELLATIELY
jgi:hypothetical protein